MKKLMMIGLAAASLSAIAMPGAAFAGDEDDARVAIAAAKAKLDSAEKAGVGGNAGDVLNKSRTILEEANARFKKDEDRHATVLANEANALADLAVATAELRALETERSKIAVN
ncbi:DUF4398 domain-containing protein [Sphingomonas sp. SRS2]|uniref:DUF4398 domain-containing protein n=1 Tax=Sphingomonas sp. SRS2 TaxID=133190 RepID=UPI0006184E65|nr:DUF4398 domain-containing protein [Sphingomonas sp. SRS2]KKC26228.1 hypothetical protein WP12_09085 [Sphingomonas sp. SRS2]